MQYQEYLTLREDILNWLKKRLKPNRYQHTLGVEQMAVQLARLYMPEDTVSASLAALLHDNAKNLPIEDQQKITEKHFKGLQIPSSYASILHQYAGAAEAKKRYPDLSDDIVHAICYHTTGRPGMSTLEKIIYSADFAEPGREPFEGLQEARQMLLTDLDKGFVMILNHTNRYLMERGKDIFPLTIETIEYYH